jgi:hypothetical protein
MNLSKQTKVIRHSAAVAAGTSTITPSTGVDARGFGGCMFIASFGTITATAVTSVEVHSSSDDGVNDAYALVPDTEVTVADSDDGKAVVVDVTVPRERYLKCVVLGGTANAVLDSITAILYDPSELPTSRDSTVVGRQVVSGGVDAGLD